VQIYVIGQGWGAGHQNTLKAQMKMYLSSQNNTDITNILYRKLWEILRENY
jgi:hypothetical protein